MYLLSASVQYTWNKTSTSKCFSIFFPYVLSRRTAQRYYFRWFMIYDTIKCELIDWLFTKLLITSANSSDVERTRLLSLFSFNGIVSVTISSVRLDALILSYAGPERTACVQKARTLFAPLLINKSAAFVSVPAVSHISSTRITSFPVTSPITVISATSFAFLRCL